ELLAAGSAAAAVALGGLHLVYTFTGTKLHPRDGAVLRAMQHSPLVITQETTMWQAWVGFNASHSYGAMLFGLIYGYLALMTPELLFDSWFLRLLGLLLLAGYAYLCKRYWFSSPLLGIAL